MDKWERAKLLWQEGKTSGYICAKLGIPYWRVMMLIASWPPDVRHSRGNTKSIKDQGEVFMENGVKITRYPCGVARGLPNQTTARCRGKK